jgi:inosine-uridine nucleoside N-ribohydrolase
MLMEPELASNLAGIVLMGGNAFCGGNASPAAEANILNDPEAADIVLGADCPVVMAGLDVTEATFLTGEQIDAIATVDNPRARHASAILPLYRSFNRTEAGQDGIFVHDSTVISYLLAPQHYRSVDLPVRVDTGHGLGRGKTWPSKKRHRLGAWEGRRPVTILTEVDAPAVVALELDRLGLSL